MNFDFDCTVMSFGERFVMIGSIDDCLVPLLDKCQGEINHELLGSSDSEVRMDEGYSQLLLVVL